MKKRVLFIWPHHLDTMIGIPVGFGYLLSNCKNSNFHFELIDCVLDKFRYHDDELYKRILEFNPSLVGISCSSSNFNEALKIIKRIKALNNTIITILGGPHATAYSHQAFENDELDFLFMGEAEIEFTRFLNAFDKSDMNVFSKIDGLAYKDPQGNRFYNKVARIENLDDLKIPDYDAIKLEKYIAIGYNYLAEKERCAPIYCTRGCPYRCKFCSVPVINGTTIRKHSVSYLIDWFKYLYEVKNIRGFNIIDDNFTFDINFAKEFCQEVINLGYFDIEINTPNGIRMQKGDLELWKLMKKAGWKVITVAPESGSKRVLKLMKKALNPNKVPKIVSEIRSVGLLVKGFFIIGYPGETIADLKETENLIRLCNFDYLSVTFFQPMPGTPVYDELVKNNEINPKLLPTHFKDSQNPVFTTKTLEGSDLPLYREKLLKLRKYC